MRYTEHDEDKMIRVRASEWQQGADRIRELEMEVERLKNPKVHDVTDLYEEQECRPFSATLQKDMMDRITRLEAELAKANQLLKHAGILKAQEEFNAERKRCKTAVLALNHSQADNARLRSCLKRLEWAGNVYEEETGEKWHPCPACMEEQTDGHAPDCWLAAESKEGK